MFNDILIKILFTYIDLASEFLMYTLCRRSMKPLLVASWIKGKGRGGKGNGTNKETGTRAELTPRDQSVTRAVSSPVDPPPHP